MPITVSKSQFKADTLALLRQVQRTGTPIIITDRGTPVLRLEPYREGRSDVIDALRGSVTNYSAPTESVGNWG